MNFFKVQLVKTMESFDLLKSRHSCLFFLRLKSITICIMHTIDTTRNDMNEFLSEFNLSRMKQFDVKTKQ